MPTNKHAQLRYKTLDRCFSDFSRYYTIEDLLDEVNEDLDYMYGCKIALRQLRQDISDMKGSKLFCAPIEYYKIQQDGKPLYYYRYSDSKFSIYKTELKEDELKTLKEAIEMLGKYRGGQANAWLEEVITNLEYRFGIVGNSENVVSFEQNPMLKGLEFLSDIIDSTIDHQPLLILYRTYSGNEIESVLHPYYVKQYNNRWYLFGLEESSYGNRIANRPFDRIVRFSKAKVPFIPNTCVDFSTYFNDVVGVTIPEGNIHKEKVILKFDKARFPYVLSKPIHSSQIVLDEEKQILQIEVRPNKELEAYLFSFGPQVEVLQPTWLREQFVKKIQEYLNIYAPMQIGCTAHS